MTTQLKLGKHCVPCEGGIPPITGKKAKEWMHMAPEWKLEKNKKIVRGFTFKNFKQALAFVNKVGEIAEEEGHHPDIEIHWNKVTLTLWTHAIEGLSTNDFIMARKINALA